MATFIPTQADIDRVEDLIKKNKLLAKSMEYINTMTQKAVAGELQRAKILQEEVDTTELLSKANAAALDQIREEIRITELTETQLEEKKEHLKRIIADTEQFNKLGLEEQQALRARLELTRDLVAAYKLIDPTDRLKEIKQERAEAAKILKQEEVRLKALRNIQGVVTKVGGLLGLSTKKEDTWLRSIEETLGSIGKGGGSEAFRKLGASIKAQFNPTILFDAGLKGIVASTIKVGAQTDAAGAALSKATSTTTKYNTELTELRINNAQYNINAEKAGEIIASLNKKMSSFYDLSKKSRAEIEEFSAKMVGMGVSVENTAEAIATLTKVLGLNVSETIVAQGEIAAIAAQLGISQDQMSSDFASAVKKLAPQGKKAIEVFKGMAAAAKATQIPIESLLSLAGQFDTFEGAAKVAGDLNAVLGGDLLNSVELLNMSEYDRVKAVKESVAMSGRSWDAMSKQERMAVANAAGISDMTEANKLFGTSSQEFDKVAASMKLAGMSEEKMKELSEANMTVQDKMTRIIESMAILVTPLVSGLRSFLEVILALNTSMGGYFLPILIGVIGAIYLLVKAEKIALGIKALWITLTKAKIFWQSLLHKQTAAEILQEKTKRAMDILRNKTKAADILQTQQQVKQTQTMSRVSAVGAANILALGAAFLMLGAGIWMAAKGLASLGEAMKGMDLVQVLGLIGVTIALIVSMGAAMALTILAISAAGSVTWPILLAVGAAFMMMGAGIWLATQGMAALAKELVPLMTNLVPFAIVIASLGTFGILAGAGLMALAAGFGALALSLAFISSEDLKSVSGILDGMSKAADSMGTMMTAAIQITPEVVDNTERLVSQAVRYVKVQAEMKAPDQDSFVQMLKESLNIGKEKEENKKTIILELNGRELGRAVDVELGKRHQLSFA